MNVINISSLSAYNLLQENPSACIIDVRTAEERKKIGIPKINNKIYFIAWRVLPDMTINPYFNNELEDLKKNINDNSVLLFLCRSGGRSYEAATCAVQKNIKNCYNIVDGFEGGTWGAGWKYNNLPSEILA